jgi:penicillin amidase
LWLVNGISTPTFNSVGFSLPGLPVIVIGRNQHIAWGATNMMGLTSSFMRLTPEQVRSAQARQETINQRWWTSKEITVRETDFGPVLSDAPLLQDSKAAPFALRWLGHEASDELSAFLGVMGAKNWDEFRAAFSTYRVSAQNYLYADRKGNIGHVLAMGFPEGAGRTAATLLGEALDAEQQWGSVKTSNELPSVLNPPEGYLISANNRPVTTEPPLTFFANGSARIERMNALLSDRSVKISLLDLQALQRDVVDPISQKLAQTIAQLLFDDGFIKRKRESKACGELLQSWNGAYASDSAAALLFHLTVSDFAQRHYGRRYSNAIKDYILGSQAVYDFLQQDLTRQGSLAELRSSFLEACDQYPEYGVWGSFHTLQVQHLFGNLPVLGGRYRFGSFPAQGSTATLHKSAHGLSTMPMKVRYGQNSRHVSDMSNPDANYFILLGGQDGWLGSSNFLDQFPLWQNGQYMKIPLSYSVVTSDFAHSITISPR